MSGEKITREMETLPSRICNWNDAVQLDNKRIAEMIDRVYRYLKATQDDYYFITSGDTTVFGWRRKKYDRDGNSSTVIEIQVTQLRCILNYE